VVQQRVSVERHQRTDAVRLDRDAGCFLDDGVPGDRRLAAVDGVRLLRRQQVDDLVEAMEVDAERSAPGVPISWSALRPRSGRRYGDGPRRQPSVELPPDGLGVEVFRLPATEPSSVALRYSDI
jgi:hypothetical protein